MVCVIFILPLIIMIAGYLMNKCPPKKVNWFVGYRTRKSMKNEKIWKIANEYCGKLWIGIGLMMLIIAFFIYILICFKIIIFSETFLAIIVLCEVIPLLLSGIKVENKIENMDK